MTLWGRETAPTFTGMDNIHDLLDYQPDTGIFRWKVYRARGARPGDEAGHLHSLGYRYIGIGGKRYKAHRLAWYMTHGRWPVAEIDHINGDRADNRIVNLREATRSQNFQNRGLDKRNRYGATGVHFDNGCNKWRAKICVNRKQYHLGVFDSLEQAAKAYADAKARLHTFQPTLRAG